MPSSYLRAPGVVKCFYQVHPLFGIDGAINGGITQSMLLKVHCYHFQHAGPLGDNDTRKKDKIKTNKLIGRVPMPLSILRLVTKCR
jgi:hypothetical protein